MQLRDSFGQLSALNFTAIERNPPIGSEVFRFVVPAGADVLEDR